jgi:hypothetical protein
MDRLARQFATRLARQQLARAQDNLADALARLTIATTAIIDVVRMTDDDEAQLRAWLDALTLIQTSARTGMDAVLENSGEED